MAGAGATAANAGGVMPHVVVLADRSKKRDRFPLSEFLSAHSSLSLQVTVAGEQQLALTVVE